MTPDQNQSHARVQALDLLRLVAVLGVVFYHYGFLGPQINGIVHVAVPGVADFAKYGYLGVPIFFVISGFVIAYSAEGRTWSGFVIARFSRIYPTFVFCMTLTCLTVLLIGGANYHTTLSQWFANLFVFSTVLGQPYMDVVYWSLAIEIVFYGWVAVLIATGVFPRRIDLIILICFCITFVNELTWDLNFVEKIFLADDSGYFAVGLLLYEHHRGRRDPMLHGLLALSTGTAIFQSVHRLPKLEVLTGGTFDPWIVAAICLVAITAIFLATRIRRVPIPARVLLAIGGLTYPLYLLHLKLGYVILESNLLHHSSIANAAAIVVSIFILSWGVWRYVERPAQGWTKATLTHIATRIGWSARLGQQV